MQVISHSTKRCDVLIELAVILGFLKDIGGLLELFLFADTNTHTYKEFVMILSIFWENKENVFLKKSQLPIR